MVNQDRRHDTASAENVTWTKLAFTIDVTVLKRAKGFS